MKAIKKFRKDVEIGGNAKNQDSQVALLYHYEGAGVQVALFFENFALALSRLIHATPDISNCEATPPPSTLASPPPDTPLSQTLPHSNVKDTRE